MANIEKRFLSRGRLLGLVIFTRYLGISFPEASYSLASNPFGDMLAEFALGYTAGHNDYSIWFEAEEDFLQRWHSLRLQPRKSWKVQGCFSSHNFWKAGSARKGSQSGSSLRRAGVMGAGL